MKLYANIIGEGVPFVILHGFLGMSDNWKTLGKKIAELGFQVHLIDQRNHGRSPHSQDFKYQLMAEDLLVYCQEQRFDNIILLGHSMGGKTAMYFSTQYPEILDKLIIADIGPKYYPLHHQDILDGLSALDFELLSTRGEVDKELSAYVNEPGVRMFLLKNLYWKEKGKLGLRMNLDALIKNASEIGKALPKDKQYTSETLFLKGDRSNYILEDDKEFIKQQFPLASFATIANAGHWLHAENPNSFLHEVMGFIS